MHFLNCYMVLWIILCLIAFILLIRNTPTYILFKKNYWQFLLKPWKMITFAVAMGFMVLVAPYSGDPTWDIWDAGFMSILTYTTAPWFVGTMYRYGNSKTFNSEVYVAICVWLFSASWSYDGYIFLRDGDYPLTWWSNLIISSALYIIGGVFWSLQGSKSKMFELAYRNADWPAESNGKFSVRILIPMFVIMAIIATILLGIICKIHQLD